MTAKGKERAKAVTEAFRELEEKAFHGLSDDERTQFLDTFIKIYQNTTRKE